MRILILGAGAVGGYLGARLIESGADVTFLLRGERLTSIQKDGLHVNSQLGNINLKPRAISTDNLLPEFDLIVLTCKAYALINATHDIKPAIGKATRVLPLINGVSHLQYLDDFFGRETVMGGLMHLAVELKSNGQINHLNNFHKLSFGIRHHEQASCGRELETIISKSQLEYKYSTHIQHDMWEKFIFLTALAGSTCLFRGTVGEILKSEKGREYISGIFQECVAIATACGHAPGEKTLAEYKALLMDENSTYSASMLRDVEAGLPTEAEPILGDMLNRGVEKKLSTIHLGYAYAHLQVYEARRNLIKNENYYSVSNPESNLLASGRLQS